MTTCLLHVRWQVQLHTEVDGKSKLVGLGEGTYCNGSEIRQIMKNGKLGQSDGNPMTADRGILGC